MKRIIRTFSFLILALTLLASCNKNMAPTTLYSPAQIAEAIISAQDNIVPLQPLLPDEGYYADYLSDIYRLDADAILDGAIYYASGMKADEIAIFRLADSSDAKDVKDTLDNYRGRRADAFTGYAPEQAAILANGLVAANGGYVALLICEQPQKALSSFMACFSDNPPKIDANIELLPRENDEASAEPEPVERERKPPAIIDETADSHTKDDETDDKNTSADDDTAVIDDEAVDDETAVIDDEVVIDDLTDGGEPSDDAVDADDIPADNSADGDKKQEKPTADNGITNGNLSGDKETNDEKKTEEKNDNPVGNAEEIDDNAPVEDETPDRVDVYDPAAILAAWRSGDMTNLSSKNRSILEACIDVIAAVINDGMSEYEKELAINDWIVDWVHYDEDTLSNSPYAKPDPDNDNPFGAIFGQRAICSGYTSTFQLFMDLLGIECISVSGTYANTGEDHAWNMVRIDGEWYCVDVTWNDPIGAPPSSASKHRFFNVTSQFMRDTGHQWDESTTPVADAGKLYFG